MALKAVWIIILILAEFIGIFSFINYRNSKAKGFLISTIVCGLVVVFEALELILGA